MPNPNYLAGRRLEYQIKKLLEKEGRIVGRTAGSHGPYDLIASTPDGLVWFVQVKRVKTQAEGRKVITNMKKHPFMPKGEHYCRRIEVYVAETRERLGAFL